MNAIIMVIQFSHCTKNEVFKEEKFTFYFCFTERARLNLFSYTTNKIVPYSPISYEYSNLLLRGLVFGFL